jgi:hypothetical protein
VLGVFLFENSNFKHLNLVLSSLICIFAIILQYLAPYGSTEYNFDIKNGLKIVGDNVIDS